jgi:uncharacterized protein (DUF58 family)
MNRPRRQRRPRPLAPVGYQHGRRARLVRRFPTLYWTYYFIFSHTTLRLYLLLLIGVMPTVFLMMTGFEGPGFQVGFASAALILASLLAGLAACPRLAVTCEMPARVECGSTFTIRYQARNTGRRAARDITVESLIYNDYLQFVLQRPGLQWIPAGASATLAGGGRALARGIYTLPALRWDSGFPLGCWRWGGSDRRERLLFIYPRYTRLESLDLPLGPRMRTELSASAELTREAFEFAGCREYRDGDALQHVHPRSSARIGAPVVKEFQASGRSRTAILVETRAHQRIRGLRLLTRKRDTFEAALSVTAALVEALSQSDRVLELLIAGPEIHRFVSAGRFGYLNEVLDILAGIEPVRADPLERLGPMLFEEIRTIRSVCLVLTAWNDERDRFVQALSDWDVGVKVLLITPEGRADPSLPPFVQCLSARAILSGEVTVI